MIATGLAVTGSPSSTKVQPGTGELLHVLRLVFASGMAAGLLLGITAIRRYDIAAHQAWMTRAHAIGPAAGTQAFTQASPKPSSGPASSAWTWPRAPVGSST